MQPRQTDRIVLAFTWVTSMDWNRRRGRGRVRIDHPIVTKRAIHFRRPGGKEAFARARAGRAEFPSGIVARPSASNAFTRMIFAHDARHFAQPVANAAGSSASARHLCFLEERRIGAVLI